MIKDVDLPEAQQDNALKLHYFLSSLEIPAQAKVSETQSFPRQSSVSASKHCCQKILACGLDEYMIVFNAYLIQVILNGRVLP